MSSVGSTASERVTNDASAVEMPSVATVVIVPAVRSSSWMRELAEPPTASRLPTAALRASESVAWPGVVLGHVKLGDVQVLVPVARPPSRPASVV